MSETPQNTTTKEEAGSASEASRDTAAPIESNAPASTPSAAPGPKKRGGLFALIAVVVIIAALGAAWALGVFSGTTENGTDETVATDPTEIVATVNGASITRGEFEDMLADVKTSLGAQAASVPEDVLEESVLNDMIDMRLLVEAADAQEVTVTDEEVETQYTTFTSSVPDAEELAAELERLGLDEEELRSNIRQELRVRKLLDANTDLEEVEVTDAEIATLYEEAQANIPEGEEMPPLAEVSEMARAQLLQEKSAEIINAYLAELREGAEIETSL